MSVPVPLQAPFAPVPARRSDAVAERRQPRFKYWHEALIDLILQNPTWTDKQLADHLQRSPITIGIVKNSDGFRARMAFRRDEHNERISFSIIAKTQKAADLATEQLITKLEDNAVQKKMSGRDLHEIAADMLDRIGISKPQAPITIQTNVQQNHTSVTVAPDALARARSRLRQNEAVLVGEAPSAEGARGSSIPEFIIPERVSPPILDELMSLGDDEDPSQSQSRAVEAGLATTPPEE